MEMGPPPAAVNFGFVQLAAGMMFAFWRSAYLPEQASFPKCLSSVLCCFFRRPQPGFTCFAPCIPMHLRFFLLTTCWIGPGEFLVAPAPSRWRILRFHDAWGLTVPSLGQRTLSLTYTFLSIGATRMKAAQMLFVAGAQRGRAGIAVAQNLRVRSTDDTII